MKAGDYVRTNSGWISKLDYYDDETQRWIVVFQNNDWYPVYEGSVKKSSPNIIDLIEEGDILKANDFKDVYTIYEVEMFRNPYTNEKYLGIRNDFGKRPKRLYEIPLINLKIVTREQFENMEYKVGE